jgi:hypothetical protein
MITDLAGTLTTAVAIVLAGWLIMAAWGSLP